MAVLSMVMFCQTSCAVPAVTSAFPPMSVGGRVTELGDVATQLQAGIVGMPPRPLSNAQLPSTGSTLAIASGVVPGWIVGENQRSILWVDVTAATPSITSRCADGLEAVLPAVRRSTVTAAAPPPPPPAPTVRTIVSDSSAPPSSVTVSW